MPAARSNRRRRDRFDDVGVVSTASNPKTMYNTEVGAVATRFRSTMRDNITVVPIDDVPSDSRVRHYDELGEDAKERFPDLAGSNASSVAGSPPDDLLECDVVKYTDYYAISVE
jgi:hypothetical protein